MSSDALIEELKNQFAQNPRRVFARLANEYRKSGDLTSAIEICRAHVPLQPTYISGYIVLGQALYESGQLDEARSTFETALGLDPENLIALRQLGDIARQSGDHDGARSWYHRLLEVDPQNEEVGAQLAGLESSAGAGTQEPVSWSDINPEQASAPAREPSPEPRPRFTIGIVAEDLTIPPTATDPQPELLDIDLDPSDAPDERATVAGAAVGPRTEPSAIASPPIPDVELPSSHATTTIPEAHEEEPAGAELGFEFPSAEELTKLTTPTSSAVTKAPSAPAGDELPDIRSLMPDDASTGAVDSSLASVGEAAAHGGAVDEPYDPTVGRMVDLPKSPAGGAAVPPTFITETMAELYLQQGFHDEALNVYRQLSAMRPDDITLRERISRLEEGARSSISIAASISEDVIAQVKARTARPSTTVRGFFGAIAQRRPPGAEADAPAAASTVGERATTTDVESERGPVSHSAMPLVEAPDDAHTAAENVAVESQPTGEIGTPESIAPESAAPDITPVNIPPHAPAGAPGRNGATAHSDAALLAEIFASHPVRAEDEEAAVTLAGAFSEEFTGPSPIMSGRPTHAASDSLSLDEVFRGGDRPREEPRRNAPSVSFDEFFSQRDSGAVAKVDADTPPPADGPSADDSMADLETFHEWLDGLKK